MGSHDAEGHLEQKPASPSQSKPATLDARPPIETESVTSPQATAGQAEPPQQSGGASHDRRMDAAAGDRSQLPKSEPGKETASQPSAASKTTKPPATPSIADLCRMGRTDPPTPRVTEIDARMRDEIRYMYTQEWAKGLDALLETQWYTIHGLERLFANYSLQQQFAGTLERFANTRSSDYLEYIQLTPIERKLIVELLLLPMKVPNPNPSDTVLQTLISRVHVLECLLTGRVISSSPTKVPTFPQPGIDPMQRHFWCHLGETVVESAMCNPQYGVPSWPSAYNNASQSLGQMCSVLDRSETREVLYSMAVLRHLGPRHLKGLSDLDLPMGDLEERAKVAVARAFLEEEASGSGTNQVIQRIAGMFMTSLSYWRLT